MDGLHQEITNSFESRCPTASRPGNIANLITMLVVHVQSTMPWNTLCMRVVGVQCHGWHTSCR